jgi:hypothetical protein
LYYYLLHQWSIPYTANTHSFSSFPLYPHRQLVISAPALFQSHQPLSGNRSFVRPPTLPKSDLCHSSFRFRRNTRHEQDVHAPYHLHNPLDITRRTCRKHPPNHWSRVRLPITFVPKDTDRGSWNPGRSLQLQGRGSSDICSVGDRGHWHHSGPIADNRFIQGNSPSTILSPTLLTITASLPRGHVGHETDILQPSPRRSSQRTRGTASRCRRICSACRTVTR